MAKTAERLISTIDNIADAVHTARIKEKSQLIARYRQICSVYGKGESLKSDEAAELGGIAAVLELHQTEVESDLRAAEEMERHSKFLEGYDAESKRLCDEWAAASHAYDEARKVFFEAERQLNIATHALQSLPLQMSQINKLKSQNPRLFCDDLERVADDLRGEGFYKPQYIAGVTY